MDMKVKKLVIDSAAFLKNVPLWEYGEEFYCVEEVMREIKDRQTKQYINSLPIQLIFREPNPSSIKFINDFSKKTGDYASLSLADIKVLALTYQLEIETKCGSSHLRSEPSQQRIEQIASTKPPDDVSHESIEGFFVSTLKRTKSDSTLNIVEDQLERLHVDTENEEKIEFDEIEGNEVKTNVAEECEEDYLYDIEDEEVSEFSSEVTNKIEHMKLCENIDKDPEILEDSGLEEDEDDDEGWITPSNIKSINKKKQFMNEEDAEVACITSDFSMQNTLKHIGLNVLGVDGKLLTTLRTCILRCHACFKTTNKMEKIFCPYCGNKTLKRVSVTLNPDGTQKIWISTRRPINIRGTKYSLPAPKGGKHAINPILVEDQREAQMRVGKLGRAKNDPMHEDYDARAGISPFITRDVYSRSAQLGIKSGKTKHRGVYYWELKNPNVPMSTGKTRRKR